MPDRAVLRELERRLEEVEPSRTRSAAVRSTVPTGVALLDEILPRGGLPRGEAVEWLGPRSCGKTALLRALLLRRRREGEPVALVDAGRTLFAPDWTPGGAGPDGEEALWVVRPPSEEEAAWCADLLLRSGGFGTVALLLGDEPAGDGRRSRAGPGLRRSVAVRLQRLAGEAEAVLLVEGASPLAALRLRFRPGRVEPVSGVPFGPFLPGVRPVWVRVGGGREREIPILCPGPGEDRPGRWRDPAAVRDRKGRR
ncbi:MAG TPA: hypothetical protein VKA44_06530 [Gemmatimonadota bacterium]|nr:hypothetical protein [Gemmatimonadota bacterium]